MAFENGLYVIRFGTPLGEGTGVAYLHDGQLRGGDSMMAYTGNYTENAGKVTATVQAFKHTNVPGMASVFGATDVVIELSGTASGTKADLIGTSPQAPGLSFHASLQQIAA